MTTEAEFRAPDENVVNAAPTSEGTEVTTEPAMAPEEADATGREENAEASPESGN